MIARSSSLPQLRESFRTALRESPADDKDGDIYIIALEIAELYCLEDPVTVTSVVGGGEGEGDSGTLPDASQPSHPPGQSGLLGGGHRGSTGGTLLCQHPFWGSTGTLTGALGAPCPATWAKSPCDRL